MSSKECPLFREPRRDPPEVEEEGRAVQGDCLGECHLLLPQSGRFRLRVCTKNLLSFPLTGRSYGGLLVIY